MEEDEMDESEETDADSDDSYSGSLNDSESSDEE